MKNPHTLSDLRKLLVRAERVLTKPKVTASMPKKYYNELANVRGVTLHDPLPSGKDDPSMRAAVSS